MPKPSPPISLADLSAAGIRLRPYEVVTIVRELILLVARGDVAGVPSAHVIRLSSSGALSVEGPVGAGGPSVARAAQLLESLLPTTTDADPQFRIPGALKLVVARGLGVIDLPPFMSLDSFADELNRFGSSDPVETLAKLATAWADRVPTREEPEPGSRRRGSRSVGTCAGRAIRHATRIGCVIRPDRLGHPARATSDGPALGRGRGAKPHSGRSAPAAGVGIPPELAGGPLRPDAARSICARGRTRRPGGGVHDHAAPRRGRTAARGAGASTSGPGPSSSGCRASGRSRDPAYLQGRSDFRIAHGSRWRRALAALAIPALLAIGLLPGWWARSSTGTRHSSIGGAGWPERSTVGVCCAGAGACSGGGVNRVEETR